MSTIKKRLVTGITFFVFTCSIAFFSCTKEDDYKKYINGEERIYRAKPMKLKVYAGYLRSVVTFELYNPAKVEKYRIYFDSVQVAEESVSMGDTVRFSKEINNLEERTYAVSVFTIDDKGLASVKATGFVNIFGARYKSSLVQRKIAGITYKRTDSLIFGFGNAEAIMLFSEFEYNDAGGVRRIKRVPIAKTKDTLPNLPPQGNILYRTYILRDTISIDTIKVGPDTLKIQNYIVRKSFRGYPFESNSVNSMAQQFLKFSKSELMSSREFMKEEQIEIMDA